MAPAAVPTLRVLLMGGTRFIGVPLVPRLMAADHQVTLFTRGRQPIPQGVHHIKGDRRSDGALDQLSGQHFDVIIDSSGRTLVDSQRVIARTGAPSHRFLYISSAGIYANSHCWPLTEEAPTDPDSRHGGKAETEAWLRAEGIPFTSFRPTYIFGPGNYNPVESWFFDRICHNRPVPLPGDGQLITQLGHVEDLADALVRSLEHSVCVNRVYNCSGRQGVTMLGLVQAAARACGRDPGTVVTRSFNPSGLDPKARKAFPLRIAHFLVDVSALCRDLDWQPCFDLERGLRDSYRRDYSQRPQQQPDFSSDAGLFAD